MKTTPASAQGWRTPTSERSSSRPPRAPGTAQLRRPCSHSQERIQGPKARWLAGSRYWKISSGCTRPRKSAAVATARTAPSVAMRQRCTRRAYATRARRLFRLYRRAMLVQLGKREPKPEWLKVRMPGSGRYHSVRRTLRELGLHTVCEEASCPNMGECWGSGTATVMLMGDVCTRGCRFCDVASGTPPPLDPLEPRHLAEAVGRLGLDYLVVTSVNRDELPDGGAAHFAQAIVELRRAAPKTLVEVLTPDFQGSF